VNSEFTHGNPQVSDDLYDLKAALVEFSAARDWAQFHSPKNLASALSVEAAELLEHFQWLTEAQSRDLSDQKKAAVAAEMADVFLYLLNLSEKLGIDLMEASWAKLKANGEKYPVDKARGTMKKYTEL
jgi:dCTP diphosphatase